MTILKDPEIYRHVVLDEDSHYVMINCDIIPRFIINFNVVSNIKDIYDDRGIIKHMLLKCRPVNNKKQTAEIITVYLIDAFHPNAKPIDKKLQFDSKVLNEIHSYTNSDCEIFEYCKDPYKSYAMDRINISIFKLANDLTYWNFDSGYWRDMSKISIDTDSDMVYDQKLKKMITMNKYKRRLFAGKVLDFLKVPLSSLLNEPEKEIMDSSMSLLSDMRLI